MSLMDRERGQRIAWGGALGAEPFVSEARIETLRSMIAAGLTGRMKQKWDVVSSRSLRYVPKGPLNPWQLHKNYGSTPEERAWNATATAMIESDFRTAADLALRYRVDKPAIREECARKVAAILSVWASIQSWSTSLASVLAWQDYWPVLLQAALLIRASTHYTATLDRALKNKTRAMMSVLNRPNGIKDSPTTAFNNWAAVGTNALMACAVFLLDQTMFDSAVFRWRQQFDDSVKSGFLGADGQLHDNVQWAEVYRQGNDQGNGSYGLVYCNYDFAAKICAAEWARLNGTWLFDHTSPDGSSLEGLFHVIVQLNRYPDAAHQWFNTSNPPERLYSNQIYAGFDVAHALWGAGNPDSTWLIEQRGLGPTSSGAWTDTDHDFMRNTELLYRHRPLIG